MSEFAINILSTLSNLLSILTPFVLLVWFYYSHKETLSRNFFNQMIGNYGNYVKAIDDDEEVAKRLNAGIKFRILEVDNQGYFRGDFMYGSRDIITRQFRAISINWYFGKLQYRLFSRFFKKVFPYDISKNRHYVGKLFLISTMSYNFENENESQYLKSEYNIKFYRELQALEFTLFKVHVQDHSFRFPQNFILYKSIGYNFEPLEAVEKVVFKNDVERNP